MLKTRLSQWKFRKNFKKSEHQAVATEAKRRADQGMNPLIDLEVGGRACAWDRVHRHCGSDPRYASPWLHRDSKWIALVSRIFLRASPIDHTVELTLSEVRAYWSNTIQKPERSAAWIAKRNAPPAVMDPVDVYIGIVGGLGLIDQGLPQEGWREIHRACSQISKVFQMQHPDLLREMIVLFKFFSGPGHEELFLQVGHYFISMASTVLGPLHSLTTILSRIMHLVETTEAVDEFTELSFKVMLDLVNQPKDDVKIDPYFVYSLEARFVSILKQKASWREVQEVLRAKLSRYRHSLGPHNQYTLGIRKDLAIIYLTDASVFRSVARTFDEKAAQFFHQGRIVEMELAERITREETHKMELAEGKAEKILLDIVQLGMKSQRDGHRHGVFVTAAERLAKFYFGKQDFRKAQKYYDYAMDWMVSKFGRTSGVAASLSRQLTALQNIRELGLLDIETEEDLVRLRDERQELPNPENGEASPSNAQPDVTNDLGTSLLDDNDITQALGESLSMPAGDIRQDKNLNGESGADPLDLGMGMDMDMDLDISAFLNDEFTDFGTDMGDINWAEGSQQS